MMTAASVVIAYLIGSIPTGLWLGLWFRKTDIRQHGSRNIGATNTLRVLGKGLGITALVCDILKGVVPVLLAGRLSSWEYAPLVCGLAAIVGHVTSPFAGFKGGKGVATSTGVFAALCPVPTVIAVVVFAIVVGATRMVSAGSVCAAGALTVAVFVFDFSMALRILVTVAAVLVIVRHRTNLQRIVKGQENKVF